MVCKIELTGIAGFVGLSEVASYTEHIAACQSCFRIHNGICAAFKKASVFSRTV